MPIDNPGVVGNFMTVTTAPVNLYSDIAAGNDANPGTAASPKQTILGALNALPVGIAHPCTIHVRATGNYPENNIMLDFNRFNTLDYITIKAVNASDEDMFDNGLATGGGNNFLDDAGAAWSVNQFQNAYIWIYSGAGAGQIRQIASNTATRITVTVNWAVNPNATSYYAIGGGATLTGTDTSHINIISKLVSIYGFGHTGATSQDISVINSLVDIYNNYHATSLIGARYAASLGASAFTGAHYYYNYNAATTGGIYISEGSTIFPRANVFSGCNRGVYIYYAAIAIMQAAAVVRNYFLNCTTGIDIYPSGSGCINANAQIFNGCVANINPAVSTESNVIGAVPQWWT
jgi:hypothetical protein